MITLCCRPRDASLLSQYSGLSTGDPDHLNDSLYAGGMYANQTRTVVGEGGAA